MLQGSKGKHKPFGCFDWTYKRKHVQFLATGSWIIAMEYTKRRPDIKYK